MATDNWSPPALARVAAAVREKGETTPDRQLAEELDVSISFVTWTRRQLRVKLGGGKKEKLPRPSPAWWSVANWLLCNAHGVAQLHDRNVRNYYGGHVLLPTFTERRRRIPGAPTSATARRSCASCRDAVPPWVVNARWGRCNAHAMVGVEWREAARARDLLRQLGEQIPSMRSVRKDRTCDCCPAPRRPRLR
jgi:hypothetical protein